MGFDIYGLNPQNPNKAIKPAQIDWLKKPTKEEKDDYFDAIDDYEAKVIGSYFRANVWSWRPIWSFVCGASTDIFNDKDREKGQYNDGHKISKTKANRIASRLRKLDKGGIIQIWEDEMMEHYNIAKKHNNEMQKVMDAVTKNCKEEHGDDVVPMDFPEPYKTQWNEAFDQKDWGSSYLPSREFIMKFAKFCEQSGGFQIC